MKSVVRLILKLLLLTFVIEFFVFNFTTVASLFQQKAELLVTETEGLEQTLDGAAVVSSEEGMVLHFGEVGRKLNNIRLDVEFKDVQTVPYQITLTDEGNFYPYTLPEGFLVDSVHKSCYVLLYPFGEVGEVSIRFDAPAGTVVSVGEIEGNGVIVPEFRAGRMIFVLLLLMLFTLLCTVSGAAKIPCRERHIGQAALTGAVVAVLILGAWKTAHVNPTCIQAPWLHHKQYQELARAMTMGNFYLDMEVSKGVKEAVNPYDTIYLQAQGIDYRADYAYSEGRYYVYFGVVPVLLLYLPYLLVTGKDFPNYAAVFLFYSGFILSVFLLYREMIRRWFCRTPFLLYLVLGILTVSCGNYLFVMARPDLYHTPIMAAVMFTTAGLFFWIRGKYSGKLPKRLYLTAGSVCMALVAGCRPQMLLFSTLAVPLFWDEVVKERKLFSKKSMLETFCFCFPYLLTAAGIMLYNGARFGSPFDFGATYSLTSNDMTHRSYNLHQLLLGLWYFFFQPPLVTPEFPFIAGNQISTGAYMGRLTSEYIYGGVLTGNVFLWILLFMGKVRDTLKEKKLFGFAIVSLSAAVVIGAVDVTGAGILQRYTVDLIWGIWLGAILVWMAFLEKVHGTKYEKILMRGLFAVFILQFFYAIGVMFGNGDLSVNVQTSNPELFYTIRSLFNI